jgi:hypothetical protein
VRIAVGLVATTGAGGGSVAVLVWMVLVEVELDVDDCSLRGSNFIFCMATDETPTTAAAVAVPLSRVLLLTFVFAISEIAPPVFSTGFILVLELAFSLGAGERRFLLSFFTFISNGVAAIPCYISHSPNLFGIMPILSGSLRGSGLLLNSESPGYDFVVVILVAPRI